MKRVTFADKSVLVGDEFAMVLLDYGAYLARRGDAEPVHFRAIGDEGEEDASYLLGPASQLIVESSADSRTEPDNAAITLKLRQRLDGAKHLRVSPADGYRPSAMDDFDL